MEPKRMTLKELKNHPEQIRVPAAMTVAELIKQLQKLPPNLRINPNAMRGGVKPVIFNQDDKPELSFEYNDGFWD